MKFTTHVALAETTRESVANILNLHLANTLDLHSQVKQAHWTIKGPQFFARHALFDEVASHLRAQADDVAERISTLGAYPRGTVRMASEASTITPCDTGTVAGARLIKGLVDRFSRHAATMREMLGKVESEDPASADLLTEQLRAVELDLWFFESHFNE